LAASALPLLTLIHSSAWKKHSPKFDFRAFSEVREDHSFGVCAPAPLGNTISSLLSRTPLIPPRNSEPAILLPAPSSYAVSYVQRGPSWSVARKTPIIPSGCFVAPPRAGPPDRGLGFTRELRLYGILAKQIHKTSRLAEQRMSIWQMRPSPMHATIPM
jgi:hypothetical protein